MSDSFLIFNCSGKDTENQAKHKRKDKFSFVFPSVSIIIFSRHERAYKK